MVCGQKEQFLRSLGESARQVSPDKSKSNVNSYETSPRLISRHVKESLKSCQSKVLGQVVEVKSISNVKLVKMSPS